MRKHGSCGPGAQHVNMVDVARSRHDRVHEAEHVATGQGPGYPAGKPKRRIDWLF
jgi:hypothetical protein